MHLNNLGHSNGTDPHELVTNEEPQSNTRSSPPPSYDEATSQAWPGNEMLVPVGVGVANSSYPFPPPPYEEVVGATPFTLGVFNSNYRHPPLTVPEQVLIDMHSLPFALQPTHNEALESIARVSGNNSPPSQETPLNGYCLPESRMPIMLFGLTIFVIAVITGIVRWCTTRHS